jgi:hypothetical protein
MKRIDQGHLHPLLEHHESNESRPGIEPRSPASPARTLQARALRAAYADAIRNLYMAAPVHVAITHGLIWENKIKCRLIGNKLLTAFSCIALASYIHPEYPSLASPCV